MNNFETFVERISHWNIFCENVRNKNALNDQQKD